MVLARLVAAVERVDRQGRDDPVGEDAMNPEAARLLRLAGALAAVGDRVRTA